MKTPNEVLIHIQILKAFFEKNEMAGDYFFKGVDATLFFNRLTEIATENYNQCGIPNLTKAQFENLRKEFTPSIIPIIYLDNLGEIYLN